MASKRLDILQKQLCANPTAAAPTAAAPTAAAPLSGILVVDGGTAITGPLACTMLGDMGAEVIKVESPHSPDMNRPIGPRRNGHGAYFHNYNRGKLGVVLDVKKREGQAAIHKLLSKADVYIQNFRPGVAKKLGIGYEDIKAKYPNLIYVSISGFGQDGPYAGRMAFDAVLQPMTGFAVMQGEANGQGAPPQLINGYQIDKLTAWNTVQGVLAALFARSSGKARGQHVEIAMLDAGLNFFWPDGMALTGEMMVGGEDSYSGRPSRRPPQQLMRTKDGFGVLMLWPEAPHFDKTMKAITPELIDDRRFADMDGRRKNFRTYQEVLQAKIQTFTNAELVQFFIEADLPGNVVVDLADIAHDPQVRHAKLVVEHDLGVDHLGVIRETRPGPQLSSTPLRLPTPALAAPALGEHTRKVLSEKLGYSPGQIAELQQAGVFGRVKIE